MRAFCSINSSRGGLSLKSVTISYLALMNLMNDSVETNEEQRKQIKKWEEYVTNLISGATEDRCCSSGKMPPTIASRRALFVAPSSLLLNFSDRLNAK